MDKGTNDDAFDFGARLKELRQTAGMAQRVLAQKIRFDKTYISHVEHGRRQPTADFARACDEALGAGGELLGMVGRGLCPYPGLAAFGIADARWFHGRRAALAELLGLLADRAEHGGGPVLVVAPSGAGKSSLLHAGLLPALARGDLTGLGPTPALCFTPTADPLSALAKAEEHAPTADGGIWVVDQLEELFTLCPDHERRTAFLDVLTGQEARPGVSRTVVCGVRADFYGHCLLHEGLRAATGRGQLALGPMSEAELRDAIVEPARRARLDLEPGLLPLLLGDLGLTATRASTGYDPSRLPLLAHTLKELWRHREDNTLTLSGYEVVGGLRGSVATTAERAWARLNPSERTGARTMLLRLVHIGEQTDPARVRLSRRQLVGSLTDRASAERLLEFFTGHDVRLLSTADEGGITFTHEAVLDAWPRLREWIAADRASLRVHQRLTAAADSWEEGDRDPSLLLRGPHLAVARTWADQDGARLGISPHEQAFLTASSRRQSRRTTWLRALAAVQTLLLLGVIAFAVATVRAEQQLDRQNRTAHAHEQASASYTVRQGRPDAGGLLTVNAFRTLPDDVQTRSALLSAETDLFAGRLTRHQGPVYGVTYSSNGRVIATSGRDNTVRLWDAATHRQLGHALATGSPAAAVSLGPDADRAAVVTDKGVQVWDTSARRRIGVLANQFNGMNTVALTPDGKRLATISSNTRALRMWDARTLAPLPEPEGGSAGFNALAFSHDGTVLAAAGDGPVQIWSGPDSPPRTLEAHHVGPIEAVVLSRDGRTVAAAGQDGDVTWWDVPSGRLLRTVMVASPVWGLDFSPDGRTLAAGADDHSVRLWDTATGSQLTMPVGHANSIHSVVFSPDGRTLAAASSDGTTSLWDTSGSTTWFPQPASTTAALAYDKDGHVLASAANDGSVRLRDTATGREFARFEAGKAPTALTFVNGDRQLAVAGREGLTVLDAATGKPIGPKPVTGPVDSLALSRDGRILATSFGTTIRLWSTATWESLGDLPETKGTYALAFSPDGRTLAAGGYTNRIDLWNLRDDVPFPREPMTSLLTSSTIRALAYSPDGRFFVNGTDEGAVEIYPLSRHHGPTRATRSLRLALLQPLGTIDRDSGGLRSNVLAVAFSPDSRHLAVAGNDGQVRVWRTTTNDTTGLQPLAVLTGHRGSVHSLAFEPRTGTPELASASEDGSIRHWDLDTTHAVSRICAAAATTDPTLWPQDLTGLLDHRHHC
ncbi:helix-turn-helix domain-containing protein [Streptomyces sp. NPDC001678]|uniref:nSTAND1 domain-containing NTPase n=1 Tax=Streptomyces sp. NPDC001678 TaxID=3364599 RepID=UPI0036CEC2D6